MTLPSGADPLAAVEALPGVADAVRDARSTVDALLRERLMRKRAGEVAVEAGLRCARASAALDGEDRTLADLRTDLDLGPVLAGALRVAGELAPLAATLERAPLQALARAHLLAAAGLAADVDLGRPRPDAAPRLHGLAELLATPTAASAITVAAVVHGELLAVRPFAAANGVVARALARAVLVSRGLDPRAVTSPDVGHALDPDAYGRAHAEYSDGSDVAGWVRHCAGAVADGAREGLAICAALAR